MASEQARLDDLDRQLLEVVKEIPGASVKQIHDEYIVYVPPEQVLLADAKLRALVPKAHPVARKPTLAFGPVKHAEPWIHPVIALTETTRVRHRNHHGGQGLVKIWRGGRNVTLYNCHTPLKNEGDGPRRWLRNEVAERKPMTIDDLWDTSGEPVAYVGGYEAIERFHQ